jgi:MAF protein
VGLLRFAWRAAPAEIDEARYLLADPLVSALNVALAKARAVEVSADEVIVAADTLVVVDGDVLGKPTDAVAARGMLRRLRGRRHVVLTGVVLRGADGEQWGGVVSTRVLVRDYADGEIEAYIGRGEPFDKAGGYAIQDTVFGPVDGLEGCYLNVVGMPLCAVAAGLRALGVPVDDSGDGVPPCRFCSRGADMVAIRSGY